jgi:hypothetical protein
MNRIILLLILVGIGIYIYYTMFKSENHENVKKYNLPKRYYEEKNNRHVHFAPKDQVFEQKIQKIESYDEVNNVSNKSFNENPNLINTDSFIDDIFIKPIEISNTNLTLSENEYFNN